MSTAGLEACNIKPMDQKACTYDQQPITLEGQEDLNISFRQKTLLIHCCCLRVYAVTWVWLVIILMYMQAVQKGPVAVTHVSFSSH